MTKQIRYILFGQFLSTAGTWAQNFAVAWLAYNLYHSAFVLGLVACLNQLPALFVGRYAGRCVDLHLSKKFVLVIQALLVGQCILLIGAARALLSVETLVVLCMLQGLLFAFEVPALQTFIADIVADPQERGRVVTWNSLSINAGRLIGPALAGWLMARFGEIACFAVNAASYLPLGISLMLVKDWRRGGAPSARAADRHTTAANVSRYITRNRALREPLVAAAAMFALTMPFLAFIPAVARLQLKGQVDLYSGIAMATGLGAAAASVCATRLKNFSRVPRIVPPTIVAGGLLLAMATISTNVYVSGLLFLLLGFSMNLTGTLTNVWLHLHAPDQWRGSVISAYQRTSTLYPIGSIALGALALVFPVMRVLMIAGALCALFILVRRYILSSGRWTDETPPETGLAR